MIQFHADGTFTELSDDGEILGFGDARDLEPEFEVCPACNGTGGADEPCPACQSGTAISAALNAA